MVRENEVLDVVEGIYAAALDGERWPGVLTAVADIVGGVDTTLEVHSVVGAPPLFFVAGDRLPPLGIDDYLSHYAPICPRIPYLASQSPGSVGCDYEFISEQEMDRDAFYADFLGSDDLRYFSSGSLINKPGMLGGAYVHRSRRQGHPDAADLTVMTRLVPHLAQGLNLHLHLKTQSSRETRFLSLVDHLPQAIVTLDARGGVQFANDAAAAILRKGDGLMQRDGRLHATDVVANADMAAILTELFRREPDAGRMIDNLVVTRRPSGLPAYVLALHRLSGVHAVYDDPVAPAAAVFIYDPELAARPRASAMAKAFSLTHRETELAFALLHGRTLHQQAAARDVKISTERSHLKSLMRKTDTHSQADLVRLLTSFLAAIP
ncbi:MAG: PAS domain-containing protein [Alphaproteobacteria bacterium]|nr:PAS domain-containing protein [Alphaproteobacteria bacterium]